MREFFTDIRVIYADTDAMGIVYHANYVKWFEKGRVEFLREVGWPYSRIEEAGVSFPVASLGCDFKAPAYFDDHLMIKTWVESLRGVSIVFNYEISRKETGELIVSGMTKHAATDRKLKLVRIQKQMPELYKAITACL